MIDVLDHVLDKGIVIDAHVEVAVAGIDLITVEARVLVASFETYLHHAGAVKHSGGLMDGYQLKSVDEMRKAIGSGEEGVKNGQWTIPRKKDPSRKTDA
ncbi:MAG TPA: gas vesicle protein GvpJ [Vicinamibacterales bacterium]